MSERRKINQGEKVWEPIIRLFHVSLAVSVAGALISTLREQWLVYHTAFGLTALVLTVFRLGWGFIGGHYARFTSFLRSPDKVMAYLKALRQGHATNPAGHNPAAGWVMLAMILAPLALGLTGIIVLGGQEQIAPWVFWFSSGLAEKALPIHELTAGMLVALIALHLAGLVLHTWRHKENVALSMVHGRKITASTAQDERPSGLVPLWLKMAQQSWMALVSIAALIISTTLPFNYTALPTVAALQAEATAALRPPNDGASYRGDAKEGVKNHRGWMGQARAAVIGNRASDNKSPVVRLDSSLPSPSSVEPVWQQECGSCHLAFHPSLLPGDGWRKMMAGLENHFGDNAWVDEKTKQQLLDYALANQAEEGLTEAARAIAKEAKAQKATVNKTLAQDSAARDFDSDRASLQITATAYWKRKHEDLKDQDFRSATTKGQLDCGACHPYAVYGSFEDAHIRFPLTDEYLKTRGQKG